MVLDYNSTFMLFSFVGEGSSTCPGNVLDYASRGWVGKSHVVHVPHLLHLQVYASSFETSQWGEIVCCFSQGRPFLELI
jgi:hypothetical protein